MKKSVSLLVLLLVFSFVLIAFSEVRMVKAATDLGIIRVMPDGTVEGTDKIQRDGDVYTFTLGPDLGGNYWSDYNGTDTDEDGVGDTPYIINEDTQDNQPLMEPTETSVLTVPETIPEFPSELFLWFILASSLTIVLFKKTIWEAFS